MANIIILGGGFGGVVAAERLAKTLGPEHQITLISRSRRFIFYPAMVRLAFGGCEPDDVSFDLREAMLDRRVRFIEGEVARINPYARSVTLAHGEVTGEIGYDYLIFALGRRLATEQVTGFFEHAHHLLTVEAALKFGEAVRQFHAGHAVIGYCPDARLDVPAYETAFALARRLEEKGERDRVKITLVHPDQLNDDLGGREVARALRESLEKHEIELIEDFPIYRVTANEVKAGDRQQTMPYDLLMLIPPFGGAGAVAQSSITDSRGFIRVDRKMRVEDVERMYAVGDSVNFSGPKMGHMAVLQAEVAAANVLAEIEGREPKAEYNHEVKYVIDEGGADSIYLHKGLWDSSTPTEFKQGRFWSWAKRVHEKYWLQQHS
jgi:sulfide:quinone oxidoreductase